jgi:hypothetical protein
MGISSGWLVMERGYAVAVSIPLSIWHLAAGHTSASLERMSPAGS